MSYMTAEPEMLAAAAGSLNSIVSGLGARNAAAAAPTTGVVPAAADEVSALTAAQFAAYVQMYQAVSAQAAAIHRRPAPASARPDRLRPGRRAASSVRGGRRDRRPRCPAPR